jgi:hypothetical protein
MPEFYQLTARVEIWEDFDGYENCEYKGCDTVFDTPIYRSLIPGELCVWETQGWLECAPDGYLVAFELRLLGQDGNEPCSWELEVVVFFIGSVYVTRAAPPLSPVGSYTDADSGCIEGDFPWFNRVRVTDVSIS